MLRLPHVQQGRHAYQFDREETHAVRAGQHALAKKTSQLATTGEFLVPVPKASIRVGEYFATASDQLRKVTALEQDDQGRDRVHYLIKSAKIAGRKFDIAHAKASPPLLETFASECERHLSTNEVTKLREAGIILGGE